MYIVASIANSSISFAESSPPQALRCQLPQGGAEFSLSYHTLSHFSTKKLRTHFAGAEFAKITHVFARALAVYGTQQQLAFIMGLGALVIDLVSGFCSRDQCVAGL